MLKKTITYTDYNGVERTEDFYFNLSKAELAEMELSTSGGYTEMLTKIIKAQDRTTLIAIFKDFIMKSYGVKSPDGRRFIKNDEVREEFAQTEAYSILFMELATDDNKAVEFVNGILPADLTKSESTDKEELLEKFKALEASK